MRIAYTKNYRDKKLGDIETMDRSDFLKLYSQGIAIPAVTWEQEEAARIEAQAEKDRNEVKRKAAEKKAADEKAEAEKKAADEKEVAEMVKGEKEVIKLIKKKRRGRPKNQAVSQKAEARETAVDNNI